MSKVHRSKRSRANKRKRCETRFLESQFELLTKEQGHSATAHEPPQLPIARQLQLTEGEEVDGCLIWPPGGLAAIEKVDMWSTWSITFQQMMTEMRPE